MNPLVAVTAAVLPEGGSHGQPQIALYTSYVTVLDRVELAPVLLTPAHSPAAVRSLIDRCAGLVLTGGEDVDPRRYGEQPAAGLANVSPERDALECAALALALERDLPVLGICRGCQLLNVFYDGTLYQDLATERPGTARHDQSAPWGEVSHGVRVVAGSRLSAIADGGGLHVNSFHHQAVRQVGRGLEAVAVADDGVIEGIEAPDRSWVVGVQWHPERYAPSAPDSDPDRRLFDAFSVAVRARARRG